MAKFKRIWRVNSDNRWITFHYALFYPSNSDIVLSSTGKLFESLVQSYPYTWERASNHPFMNTASDGEPLGYVYKNGVQQYAPDYNIDKRRAWAFVVLDASNNLRAVEATPSSGSATSSNDSVLKMKSLYGSATVDQCKWGVAVGPMPIGGAPLSEYASRDYPYPYDNDDTTRRQVGIGLLSDGLAVHLANVDGYCSKEDMKNVAAEFNPVSFQIFDGGGSFGLIDKNDSGTNLGFNSREMRVAFMIRRAEEIPTQWNLQDCKPSVWPGGTPCS